MKVISIYNAKGGVAKTTSSLAIGYALATSGFSVCCIDLDVAQGSLTSCLLPEASANIGDTSGYSILDVLFDDLDINSVVQLSSSVAEKDERHKMHLIPCLPDKDNKRNYYHHFNSNELLFKRKLAQLQGFDFVVIDCSNTMSSLTKSAIIASDLVLVPVKTDAYSSDGVTRIISQCTDIKKLFHTRMELGVFLVQSNNTIISNEMFDSLQQTLGSLFIPVSIKESVVVPESTHVHLPVNLYSRFSVVAFGYNKITRHLLHKHFPEYYEKLPKSMKGDEKNG